MLFKVLFREGVFIGRRLFGDVRAHAVDLIVFAFERTALDVDVHRHAHRIVDVGVAARRRIDDVFRNVLRKQGVRLVRGVVGVQFGVALIHEIDGALDFRIAVDGGVVRNVEVALNIRTVEAGALEIEVLALDDARGIAHVVGGRVVHPVAVDIDARRIIGSHHQRRDDDLGVVDARFEVALCDAHERALDGGAVGVIRRIRLDAVDEVDVVALFDDETAVGDDLARGEISPQGRKGRLARRKGTHAHRDRARSEYGNEFFRKVPHKRIPYKVP